MPNNTDDDGPLLDLDEERLQLHERPAKAAAASAGVAGASEFVAVHQWDLRSMISEIRRRRRAVESVVAGMRRPGHPPTGNALIDLGVVAQSLRDAGLPTVANDLFSIAERLESAAPAVSPPTMADKLWACQGCGSWSAIDMLDVTMHCTECRAKRGLLPIPAVLRARDSAAPSNVTMTARACLAPSVIEACARAGWYAQVAFDGGIDGASTSREGFSWAFVQNAMKDGFRDSAAAALGGTKKNIDTPRVRLFHDVVWATATALLGTCPGAVTGVHAPGCAAARPPSPETSAAPSPSADDNLADAAAPVSDAELQTYRSFSGALRARGSTAMHIPTLKDLRPTVFHIVLLTDDNRRGEYRMICGVGGTRVEYRAKNNIDEDLWVSPGAVGTGAVTPNPLGFSSDMVASLMGRVIALRIALPDPPRTITNGAVRHIDLGTIDLTSAS
jgi:hypothetical protein